jgi:hypothetical protein
MLHPVSCARGEPIKNVEGHLGESRNTDVIRLTEVNQGLSSAKKELAQECRSPLNPCSLYLIELRFEKALIVDLNEHTFGA